MRGIHSNKSPGDTQSAIKNREGGTPAGKLTIDLCDPCRVRLIDLINEVWVGFPKGEVRVIVSDTVAPGGEPKKPDITIGNK